MSEPYALDDQHLAMVLAFNEDQRYAYFVAHACDAGRVYGLMGSEDEWLVWGDEGAERDVFPAWPHPRLAVAAAGEDFPNFTPEPSELDAFLEFLDVLQDDDVLVGVMGYPDGSQLLVEPADLKRDLEEFLSGAYADVDQA